MQAYFHLLVLLVFARPALGYIDPGTGSLVIQVLLGTALGTLVAIKIFWRQIKTFVVGLFVRKREKTEDESQE